MPALHVPLEPVVSTNLSAIGYDPKRRILAVQFASSGDIMHYAGVPPKLAGDFKRAESFGKFYAQHVRGKFQADKMTGPCLDCGDRGWIGERCKECGRAPYEKEPYVPKRGKQHQEA